jgi:hypothetical protein
MFEKAKDMFKIVDPDTEPRPPHEREESSLGPVSEFCHSWSKERTRHYSGGQGRHSLGKDSSGWCNTRRLSRISSRKLGNSRTTCSYFSLPQGQDNKSCVLVIFPPFPNADRSRLTALYQRITQTNIDPILEQAGQERLDQGGHTYHGAKVTDDGKLVQGNQMAAGERAPGNRHQYGKVEVSGKAIAALGDRVGMPDVFWGAERCGRAGEGHG